MKSQEPSQKNQLEIFLRNEMNSSMYPLHQKTAGQAPRILWFHAGFLQNTGRPTGALCWNGLLAHQKLSGPIHH